MPQVTEDAIAAAERAVSDAHAELERLRGLHAAQRSRTTGAACVQALDGGRANHAEIVGALRRDGAVAVHNLASRRQIDSLVRELSELEPFARRAEPGSFSGANTVSNGAYLVAASPTAQELALNPTVLGVAEQLLGQCTRRIALAVASEIKISGSGPAQVLHRDDEEWPLDLLAIKKPKVELELLAMWAASDFRPEHGATCVCPGSHCWPAGREALPSEVVPVSMPRGSVLLWLGSTVHGTGASLGASASRQGLLLGYCLSWLRPEMNMHFSCPPEVAAKLDPRIATLMCAPCPASVVHKQPSDIAVRMR